jgi:hypothetical protein
MRRSGPHLALIEQATKTMDAVHKRIHAAQAQEFELLRRRFMEDPAALWRHNKKSECLRLMMRQSGDGDVVDAQDAAEDRMKRKFVAALENCELVPQADPNTSSQMSRLMKAVAIKQLQQANPNLYNAREVDDRILKVIGWTDTDALFAPPQPPAPDPTAEAMKKVADAKATEAQAKIMDAQTKAAAQKVSAATATQTAQAKAADIQSRENIAKLNVQKEMIIHANDHHAGLAQQASDHALGAQQIASNNHIAGQQIASDNQNAAADRAVDLHQGSMDRANDQQLAQAAQQRVI